MAKISDLVLRSDYPEMQAALQEIIGHDRFIFVVLVEDAETREVTRAGSTDDVLALIGLFGGPPPYVMPARVDTPEAAQ